MEASSLKLIKELKLNKLVPKFNDAVLSETVESINKDTKMVAEALR